MSAWSASAWSAWDSFVFSHPDGSPFHLSAWSRSVENGLSLKCYPLSCDGAGGTINALVPLYHVPVTRRLVAVPFRDRGGILTFDDNARDQLASRILDLARDLGVSHVILKSLAPADFELSGWKAGKTHPWIHSRVTLAATTDQHRDELSPKVRNMIRQAERKDCRFQWGPFGLDAARLFHRIHRITQHRLGIPSFPLGFFEEIARNFSESGAAHLARVDVGARTEAAAVLFSHNDTVYYAYAASTPSGRAARAPDFLVWNSLIAARDSGARFFDLGSDSPRQSSLLFFKRKWLAVQAPTHELRFSAPNAAAAGNRDDETPFFRACRRVWRGLPRPIADRLGERIVKYLA